VARLLVEAGGLGGIVRRALAARVGAGQGQAVGGVALVARLLEGFGVDGSGRGRLRPGRRGPTEHDEEEGRSGKPHGDADSTPAARGPSTMQLTRRSSGRTTSRTTSRCGP